MPRIPLRLDKPQPRPRTGHPEAVAIRCWAFGAPSRPTLRRRAPVTAEASIPRRAATARPRFHPLSPRNSSLRLSVRPRRAASDFPFIHTPRPHARGKGGDAAGEMAEDRNELRMDVGCNADGDTAGAATLPARRTAIAQAKLAAKADLEDTVALIERWRREAGRIDTPFAFLVNHIDFHRQSTIPVDVLWEGGILKRVVRQAFRYFEAASVL